MSVIKYPNYCTPLAHPSPSVRSSLRLLQRVAAALQSSKRGRETEGGKGRPRKKENPHLASSGLGRLCPEAAGSRGVVSRRPLCDRARPEPAGKVCLAGNLPSTSAQISGLAKLLVLTPLRPLQFGSVVPGSLSDGQLEIGSIF